MSRSYRKHQAKRRRPKSDIELDRSRAIRKTASQTRAQERAALRKEHT